MEDLKLTPLNAIRAHCHQCLGYYADGKQDCENPSCPLYNWMPFRKMRPDLTWIRYDPRRKGRVLRSEIVVSHEGNPKALQNYRQQKTTKEPRNS